MEKYEYKPFKYWFLSLSITWASMFTVAYFSYIEMPIIFLIPFMLIALFTPFIVAMFMIFGSKNKDLINDFKRRLFNFKLINPGYWLFIIFIMPATMLLATLISIFFNQPVEQFYLHPELAKGGWQVFVTLIAIILAPTFEELGWRGYGVDSLKKERSIIKATSIFAILWALWHVPLFFIKGYYQNTLLDIGVIYVVNFFAQLIVAAFLMNWVYYKNNRSIFSIIVFHSVINLSAVSLQTEQFTKLILTIILTIIFVVIFMTDKEFWLK